MNISQKHTNRSPWVTPYLGTCILMYYHTNNPTNLIQGQLLQAHIGGIYEISVTSNSENYFTCAKLNIF